MDPAQMAQLERMAAANQDASAFLAGAMLIPVFIMLAFSVVMLVAMWKLFSKAGQPGWAVIVPIYNLVVFAKIIKKPSWWILFLIPFVNMIFGILACFELAKVFGKDSGYGVGLLLLGVVFYPLLAFGDARYVGDQPALMAQRAA